MRKSANSYIDPPVKTRRRRLMQIRYDELAEQREVKAAYGCRFFSPALQRHINEKIYNKT
jgi:hypothetical protein